MGNHLLSMHKFKHISHRYFPENKVVKREVQVSSYIWVNAEYALRKKEIPLLHEHSTSATSGNHYIITQLTNSD